MKMDRILEPELMDEEEQAEAYANANFDEPHSRFIDLFKNRFNDYDGKGHILDVGCGPADISIRFADAFPKSIIHGYDGSEAMIKRGVDAIKKREKRERITLYRGRIGEIRLPRSFYDVVICNSVLHHLHKPSVFWDEIKSYSDKTKVFVADLRRPTTLREAVKIANLYSSPQDPEVLRRDFYNSLLAAFTVEEVQSQLQEAGLQNLLRVNGIGDRHLAITGVI